MGGVTAFVIGNKFANRISGSVLFAPAIKLFVTTAQSIGLSIMCALFNHEKEMFPRVMGRATKNPQITDDIKKEPTCNDFIFKISYSINLRCENWNN